MNVMMDSQGVVKCVQTLREALRVRVWWDSRSIQTTKLVKVGIKSP